jgi:hypothetical protein
MNDERPLFGIFLKPMPIRRSQRELNLSAITFLYARRTAIRLFNTGRCGVGQRFSHVYSRPTQPLQDSQRDRRNEGPDDITEFVCEDCGDHVHVFGHYYGLPVHSTCPLHPRTSEMPERGDT